MRRPARLGVTRISARRLAALSALFNLPFVLLQAQRNAYDSYTHIFFADHYRQNWWSLWEPRWYLGFSLASYPPLAHQLIALISWPAAALIRFFAQGAEAYPGASIWAAEETGYVLVLLAALVIMPLALRAFARLFVGPRAADLAGLLTIVLPALSLTAWSFGQLPTLLATGAVLLAMTRGAAYARLGSRRHLIQGTLLAAVAAATHHAVFLFVPFAGLAVGWRVLATASGGRLGDWRRWTRPVLRLALWAVVSGVAVALVLWPLLAWSRGQQLQAPIAHASRDNIFLDNVQRMFFFWPMYGPLLLVLPWAAWAGLRLGRGRLLPLLLLDLLLFVLGLGGTTLLPQILFGAGWTWLTYDRFAFWAALGLLPFAGAAGLWLWARRGAWGRLAALTLLAAMAGWASVAGWLSDMAQAQPPALDLAPVAQFLDAPAHQPYRYFTLGFGDRLAQLSAITQNGTPDGDYHTARMLPELRLSGLGSMDGAVWNPQGVAALLPLLADPGRYGARWAFVYNAAYVPILVEDGWRYQTRVGQVQLWEHAGVTPVAAQTPPQGSLDRLASIWWGVAPLSLLVLALVALAAERRWPLPPVTALIAGLRRLRQGAWVATIALLGLWWIHVIWQGSAPGVYFTYQSVIIYASDIGAALTVIVWAVERSLRREPLHFGPRWVGGAALALILAVGLSLPTSVNRALTAAVLAHLLLVAGWYWIAVNDPPPLSLVGGAFAVWLVVEAGVALVETVLQSAAWLHGLHLPWPGDMTPAVPGASVVQTASGLRWLRAYGTLPNPNILGGFLLIGLGAVVERYVSTGRRVWLVAGALGMLALVLSFSRASWFGAGVMLAAGGWVFWRYADPTRRRQRYWRAMAVLGAAGLVLVLPLLPLLVVRSDLSAQTMSTEVRSVQQREQYASASLRMLAAHPVLGTGAGTFVVVVKPFVPEGTSAEPVHNLLLLIAAETGLVGGLAAAALGLAIAWRAWQRRRQASTAEIMWALVLLGLLVTGLFDHYWWTAPPAQLAFATALGLWAGGGRQG